MPYYVYRASDLARIAKDLVLKEMPVSLRLMGIKLSSLKDRKIDEDAVKKVVHNHTFYCLPFKTSCTLSL